MCDFDSFYCSPFAEQRYQDNNTTIISTEDVVTEDIFYCSPFAAIQCQDGEYQSIGTGDNEDVLNVREVGSNSILSDLLAEIDSWNEKFNVPSPDYRRYPPMCSSSFAGAVGRPLSPVMETGSSICDSSFSTSGEEGDDVFAHDVQQLHSLQHVSQAAKSNIEYDDQISEDEEDDYTVGGCGLLFCFLLPFRRYTTTSPFPITPKKWHNKANNSPHSSFEMTRGTDTDYTSNHDTYAYTPISRNFSTQIS
eukprot:TRINITY_DN1315_c0_g2_i1.p1 TRINITY_DN1315_c0_g2~~TRINITY_DN1315_c0_g2_i1.p1  ORF type:complete len:250 (-),score=38.06 TRINITY_DN1315_c0_g2_i1:1171-1920(-)